MLVGWENSHMQDLETLYRQLEEHLGRPLTSEERRLLALSDFHPAPIPIFRTPQNRKPTGT